MCSPARLLAVCDAAVLLLPVAALQVAEVVESVGARPLSSFRMALQGQCKALLDASHARCMTQLQGLLEAEQWVAVDVPAGFQVRNQPWRVGAGCHTVSA